MKNTKKRKNNKNNYQKIIIFVVALVITIFKFVNDEVDFKAADTKTTTDVALNTGGNEIQLEKCVDGDTATFSKIGKTRFLIVDTPESTRKIEPYGKKAAKFTCDKLTNAKKITFEYDGSRKDRYDRTLAWIFVDGELLQELIAKEGYIKKFYIYKKSYKYENRVRASLNDKNGIFVGK